MKVMIVVALAVLLGGCGTAEPPPSEATVQSAAPAPPSPDEDAAIETLLRMNEAESGFFQRNRRYALDTGELRQALFLSAEPSQEATGYEFRLRPSPDAARYTITAIPLAPSATTRYFFTDQSGVIRSAQGGDATATSPAIGEQVPRQ